MENSYDTKIMFARPKLLAKEGESYEITTKIYEVAKGIFDGYNVLTNSVNLL